MNPTLSLSDPPRLSDVVVAVAPSGTDDSYLAGVHPDDVESLVALVDLAPLSGAHAIVRVRRHAGGWMLVEHTASVDERGVVLERHDVTRREAERARVGRTDAYWRTILRNGHEAIAVLDPESRRIRHASDHLAEVLDVDPRMLVRRHIGSLIHPDDEPLVDAAFARLDRSKEQVSVEFRLLIPDRPPRWFEAVVSDARHDPDVAAVVLNLRDIEDRKRVEQQLRASEHLFRTLLGQLADGAMVVDRFGVVRFASERLAEILEVPIDDVVDAPMPFRRRLDGRVVLSTDPTPAVVDPADLPAEIIGTDHRWFELTINDLSSDPVVDGVVIALRDVTDRRRDVERLQLELELDVLTGLLNRRGFETKVQARLDAGERLQLAFLDLDGFKAVNDSHGHGVGDELLRRVALRLIRASRSTDLVARLGGDEFVVAASAPSQDFVGRLAATLDGTYRLGDVCVTVGASAGGCAVGGDVGLSEALRIADTRMYADKRRQPGSD